MAERGRKRGVNSRVILATDGDFNVGIHEVDALEALIAQKRESGIYLSVLGFGTGNIKDNRMEALADNGNDNYAYIDSMLEARKVLVAELGGTLHTIARDVKLQVEFNPATVQAYRLIGYENRHLQKEDFNNDRKDAGELGAGQTVTALYEVIPVGAQGSAYSVDPLKYQKNTAPAGRFNNELCTVKVRYKNPAGGKSKLISNTISVEAVKTKNTSNNFRWSAAVAEYCMWLRNSPYLEEDTTLS